MARDIAAMWWAMLAGAGALALLVLVLVVLAFGPPRPVSARRWTHGLGLGLSALVLVPLLVAALRVGERAMPRDPAEVVVQAHATQWQWQFSHIGPEGPVRIRDRLILPAGQPVDVLITSSDVIHSFWVPQLAGKIDAIPGRTNRLRLQADAPGRHAGQCAEFCGRGHGGMRFEVLVVPPEMFAATLTAAADTAAAQGETDD